MVCMFLGGCTNTVSEKYPNENVLETFEEVEGMGGFQGESEQYVVINEKTITDAQEIFDVFMGKYPNAKVNEIELEREGGKYQYEIEGYEGSTKYELRIDATTKEILKEKRENNKNEYGEIKRDQLDKVDQYVKKALDDSGEGYLLKEWKLKAKNDYIEFTIELENNKGKEIKYKYNYETGELLGKK